MRRLQILALAVATACSPEAPRIAQSAAQAAAPEAAGLASTALQDAGSAMPSQDGGSAGPLPIASAQALRGDVASPLARDDVTLVDPGSSFRVEVQARIDDARLVLLDEQDAMVPVQGTAEVAPTTRFTLAPSEPLRPGSSYTLRLEGAARREAHDADGRAYLPAALRLRTTGERPPPAKRSKRGRKRH